MQKNIFKQAYIEADEEERVLPETTEWNLKCWSDQEGDVVSILEEMRSPGICINKFIMAIFSNI